MMAQTTTVYAVVKATIEMLGSALTLTYPVDHTLMTKYFSCGQSNTKPTHSIAIIKPIRFSGDNFVDVESSKTTLSLVRFVPTDHFPRSLIIFCHGVRSFALIRAVLQLTLFKDSVRPRPVRLGVTFWKYG
jgi:hypothetical protein